MSKAINIDITVVALITGLIAIAVIFVPETILLMGVFAFMIGFMKFYSSRKDFVALIAMILGLVVIILVLLVAADVISIK